MIVRIITRARILMLASLLALGTRPCVAQQSGRSDFRQQSEYLLRLAELTEWPQLAGENPRSAFNFCVLGRERYGEQLEKALLGHSIADKRIVIVRGQYLQDMGKCDVLLVGDSKSQRKVDQLKRKPDSGVLTVGDQRGFAAHGGVIEIVAEQDRISFFINIDAARRAGLKIGASLLALATIVHDEQASLGD